MHIEYFAQKFSDPLPWWNWPPITQPFLQNQNFLNPSNWISSKIFNPLPPRHSWGRVHTMLSHSHILTMVRCMIKFWIRHCTCTLIFNLLPPLIVWWICIIWYIPREIETSKSFKCTPQESKVTLLAYPCIC